MNYAPQIGLSGEQAARPSWTCRDDCVHAEALREALAHGGWMWCWHPALRERLLPPEAEFAKVRASE